MADGFVVRLTILLVIAAFLQFIALIWQAVVLKGALSLSKDTAQRQLRAYIGVSSASMRMINKNTLAIVVCIKNFGKTPALKVRHFIDHKMGKYPLRVTLEKPTKSDADANAVIFPTIESWAQDAVDLSKEPIVEGMTLFVYGHIIYEDVFGHERWTKFLYLFPAPNVEVPLVIGSEYLLTINFDGNEAD
jgi:hypothetical protein